MDMGTIFMFTCSAIEASMHNIKPRRGCLKEFNAQAVITDAFTLFINKIIYCLLFSLKFFKVH